MKRPRRARRRPPVPPAPEASANGPGAVKPTRASAWAVVYDVVRRIPRGRVATYGQVAALAGLPRHARLVGYALHALPEGRGLPWHRVVNAQGRMSPRSDGLGHDTLQRLMLEREGVRFSAEGALSLARYQWRPRASGPPL